MMLLLALLPELRLLMLLLQVLLLHVVGIVMATMVVAIGVLMLLLKFVADSVVCLSFIWHSSVVRVMRCSCNRC